MENKDNESKKENLEKNNKKISILKFILTILSIFSMCISCAIILTLKEFFLIPIIIFFVNLILLILAWIIPNNNIKVTFNLLGICLTLIFLYLSIPLFFFVTFLKSCRRKSFSWLSIKN